MTEAEALEASILHWQENEQAGTPGACEAGEALSSTSPLICVDI